MIDLTNLYANMSHVCAGASTEEIETMLRVIGLELDRRQVVAGGLVISAADELRNFRAAKRTRGGFLGTARPHAPSCEDPDEGGEA